MKAEWQHGKSSVRIQSWVCRPQTLPGALGREWAGGKASDWRMPFLWTETTVRKAGSHSGTAPPHPIFGTKALGSQGKGRLGVQGRPTSAGEGIGKSLYLWRRMYYQPWLLELPNIGGGSRSLGRAGKGPPPTLHTQIPCKTELNQDKKIPSVHIHTGLASMEWQ